MDALAILAEFHCHSVYSPDSLVKIEDLIETCQARGIRKVAITDHNSIAGALIASKLAPDMVIVGEEIETTEGELIAYFMTEEIPYGLPPIEVIKRLKDQGAFISISHPFDEQRNGHWNAEKIEEILPDLDAIEVFNARCLSPRYNQTAADFAKKHQISGLAGSDAHSLSELGRAAVLLPDFNSAQELRHAVRTAGWTSQASSPLVHLVSTFSKLVQNIHRKSKFSLREE